MKILITGYPGQLAKCIYDIVNEDYYDHEFIFVEHKYLDIGNSSLVHNFFLENNAFDFIVNCAAYTNVEKAENDIVEAFNTNSKGISNLVSVCEEYDIPLIHISTDYVYDSDSICTEDSTKINPLSIYAQSKRDGEIFIEKSNLNKWFIFRTSWLYSEYNNNFVTNTLSRASKFADMYGATDEIGSPTYARTLAGFIVHFINSGLYMSFNNGIYNFSNAGYASRYTFMQEILNGYMNLDIFKNKFKHNLYPQYSAEVHSKLLKVSPITQKEAYERFNLKASRPNSTTLCINKIQEECKNAANKLYMIYPFIEYFIPWQSALGDCLLRYNMLHIND